MPDQSSMRRDLLLAPLLLALPYALRIGGAEAAKINPSETIVRLPNQIEWKPLLNAPAGVVDSAALWGAITSPGLYFVLVRWHPGYMSAPHTYETDRLCVVVSGTWWVNSGADFDPANCVPVPAGSFVHRVARTPHYDGVPKGKPEPAVIAICGMGPVGLKWVDSTKPGWREA